jgi:hypothetical protein
MSALLLIYLFISMKFGYLVHVKYSVFFCPSGGQVLKSLREIDDKHSLTGPLAYI